MGIYNLRYIQELQVNGQTVGDEDNFTVDDGAADNTAAPADQADAAAENTDETTADEEDDFTIDDADEEDLDNTEETNEEENQDDTTDDADDDFTLDDTEEGGEDTGDTEENTEETSAEESESSTDPTDNISDEDMKQAEEQIYDSLTDNQKRIRILQLKIDYRDLYETIENTIDGINEIPKNAENIETFSKLITALTRMRKILIDYIENNFDRSSYLENYTMYIKYMAAFRTISKVIEETNKDKK